MYSKLVVGLAMAGAASAAQIVKRDGASGGHSHSHDHGAAAAAPADGYGAPAASYGAPAPSYGAPAPSYGAPAPSYSAPSTGYGQEASYGGYEEEGGIDLTAIIIPLLILLGLSLLFPGIVSVNVRKRRDAEDLQAGKTTSGRGTKQDQLYRKMELLEDLVGSFSGIRFPSFLTHAHKDIFIPPHTPPLKTHRQTAISRTYLQHNYPPKEKQKLSTLSEVRKEE